MKKFALLFALILGFGLTGVQAQSHCDKKASKSCAQKCSKADKSADKADAGSADAAAKLASMDESIDMKVCEYSGNVSYTRKAVGDDGEVNNEPVSYSASTNKFVSLTDSEKKSCCASGSGNGEGSSANAGKASSSDSGAACCSKKGSKNTKSEMKHTQAVGKKSSK
ncbi:MAG: hypothetical protein DRI69_08725 [Bacteroidetes bacterium]|nr:MAG: hypothetical protein DRI69_08725 [Bacteroidota bacterium]